MLVLDTLIGIIRGNIVKKIKSKSFFEYTKKLTIHSEFGEQKVPLCNFVEYATDCVEGNELDFVFCFDKRQEDWEFTNKIGIYGMGEVVDLLVNHADADDAEWKKETIQQLEAWLKMLKGG